MDRDALIVCETSLLRYLDKFKSWGRYGHSSIHLVDKLRHFNPYSKPKTRRFTPN